MTSEQKAISQTAQWAVCQGNEALIAGQLQLAVAQFQAAAAIDPAAPGALLGLGKARSALALWQSARGVLEQALAVPADAQAARHALWEVCQVLGDRDAAVSHLRAAVQQEPVTTRPATAPARRVLAINAVGDFQANLPLGPLLSAERTALSTLWLDPDAPTPPPPDRLPPFDAVFIAIAEDARHAAVLAMADTLARQWGRPIINTGAGITRLSRDGASHLLAGLPGAIVPDQQLVSHATLLGELALPAIIRPRGSHAGEGLARIDTPAERDAYLAEQKQTGWFYTAPFIDYRNADGQWRKYRIIFVDGAPYPFHLAIHTHWAVWYYNAGMAEDAAKRAEEARFLGAMTDMFPPAAMAALEELGRRVGLDYFGLDCALMPDGRLLVFEVETGMLVHDADPRSLYPYKEQAVGRIFTAVEAMLDRRIAAAVPRNRPAGGHPSVARASLLRRSLSGLAALWPIGASAVPGPA